MDKCKTQCKCDQIGFSLNSGGCPWHFVEGEVDAGHASPTTKGRGVLNISYILTYPLPFIPPLIPEVANKAICCINILHVKRDVFKLFILNERLVCERVVLCFGNIF